MDNIVNLWFSQIFITVKLVQHYETILDTEEHYRAGKFRNETTRNQFIIVHGMLRTLLSEYTGIAPQHLKIARQEHGKPFLPGSNQVVFNLSHSNDKVLIGIASGGHLGVDIEDWNDQVDYAAIAKQCFAVEELDYWEALPEAEKPAEFYRFWTRKEAFVKAVGCGINVGLSRCVVSPHQPSKFLSIPELYGPARDWNIVDLNLGNKVYGAFVVSGHCYDYVLKKIA